MLLNPQFVSGTLEEAVEALAKLAADCRTRPLTFVEKQALAGSDTLSALGRYIGTPTGAALLGGGLGAAAGGIGTAFANRGKPEGERRSVLSSALTGGLAGAAIGGGGVAAAKGLSGLRDPGHAPVKGAPIPIPGSDLKLDPRVMTAMPDAHKRLQELAEPDWSERVMEPLSRGWEGIKEVLPVSSRAVPAMAGYDLLTNTQQRFGGKMLGDMNWLHAPGAAASWVANKMHGGLDRVGLAGGRMSSALGKLHDVGEKLQRADYGIGMIDPRNSTHEKHLEAGIDAVLQDPKKYSRFMEEPGRAGALKHLRGDGGQDLLSRAKTRQPEAFTHSTDIDVESPSPSKVQELIEERYDRDGTLAGHTRKEVMVPQPPTKNFQTVHGTLTPEDFHQLKEIGARVHLDGMDGAAKANPSGIPRVRRGIRGGTTNASLSSPSKLLQRLAMYVGVPAVEFAVHSARKGWERGDERAKLIEQMRQNGLIAE